MFAKFKEGISYSNRPFLEVTTMVPNNAGDALRPSGSSTNGKKCLADTTVSSERKEGAPLRLAAWPVSGQTQKCDQFQIGSPIFCKPHGGRVRKIITAHAGCSWCCENWRIHFFVL